MYASFQVDGIVLDVFTRAPLKSLAEGPHNESFLISFIYSNLFINTMEGLTKLKMYDA